MLPILFYNQLDRKGVQKSYNKVLTQLRNGDFKSADVRKMTNTGFYRARLNIKDRLLFTFVSYNGNKYLLLLEVILNHEYAKSRFLRTAQLPDEEAMQPVAGIEDVQQQDVKHLSYVNESVNRIHILSKCLSFDDLQQA